MKFNALTLPDSGEDGAEMHLRHPAHGYPLYTGPGSDEDGRLTAKSKKPQKVTITVRSYDSDAVRDALRKLGRRAMKSDEDTDNDALVDALIVDWFGLEDDDGKPWPCTKANKVSLLKRNREIDRQIMAFAQRQANFFGEAASD